VTALGVAIHPSRNECFAKLDALAAGILSGFTCSNHCPADAQAHHQAPGNMTSVQTDLQREVAALMVDALNLDISPETIEPQAPLYGEGLGLDSIDILEVALVVSKRYGFQLRSDDEDNIRIFASLASLVDHIAGHRTL
jgi:acyl carrier protein